MNDAALKLRILRHCLAPALELAADMGRITLEDETFHVLEALHVAPTIDLALYAMGNKLDKMRFRKAAA